jgi:predicted DNA-binding transcriptional regulator YafY
MFSGVEKRVTIRFDQELLNVVIDRFGIEVDIKKVDEKYFEITETVYVSPTFLSWVIQFQNKAKIIEPIEVIEEMKQTLEITLKNYE